LAAEIKSDYNNNIELINFMLGNLHNTPPIVFTSTTQVGTEYSNNKQLIEQLLSAYKGKVYIYHLSNVFGRWCKPNYNSVVATFIHNVRYDKELTINDPQKKLRLIYIDDLVVEFERVLFGGEPQLDNFQPSYEISVGDLAQVIQTFKINKELHTKLFKTFHG
jgi:UDP-2-acetamido-2,6-beta-L-arabino-hexul-4-ose reductase